VAGKLKNNYDDLVREATKLVENVPPVVALDMMEEGGTVIIDVRDIRELQRDGCIPGSYHVPRGLIESWIDPDSDYFKPIFAENHKFLICCASGRRSALTVLTLKEMGFDAANMVGGFAAWKLLDGAVSDFGDEKHIDLFDPEDQLVEL
jgi:rhodanese-related sulfurtransferase